MKSIILPFINYHNPEILIKISISLILGLIIGLEREMTNKTAGLRTHILICLGSTMFTILSLHGFTSEVIQNGVRIVNDPARIAAQILTGIGFIGGGAVLHYGANVYGLTTAATIWVTASLGMAVGVGSYELAIITTVVTFLVLVVIRKFESGFLSNHINKGATIRASVICSKENMSEIQDWFYKEFKNIEEVDANKILSKKNQIKLTYIINVVDKNPVNSVHKKLLELDNIESLALKQIIK
ncbi:MAG: MgtC/SapB family protein [bacterium]